MLRVTLRQNDSTLGELELEVRSRKLHYRSEYRWMLRDIADHMTELVMQRFAMSSAHFEQDVSGDATTLYQRFEFLRALLAYDRIETALHQIRRRPHVAWEDEEEAAFPGQSLRANARVTRSISSAGKRVHWPNGPVATIPATLKRFRTEATHDTTPNRFVRFVLERWRQVVSDIQFALASAEDIVRSRGLRETSLVLQQLDEVLHDDLFKEVGPLGHFPADNQVLHRREGYRDIFRAYLEFELAAKLSWKRDETSHRGGQRDVATLYEYWAFLHLAELVADLVGISFDISSILEIDAGALSVGLRSGRQTVISGAATRHSRRLSIEFCFNRTFRGKKESWTVPMRPDYSLLISPAPGEPAIFEPVILHFDAKYRINAIEELVGHPQEEHEQEGYQDLSRQGAKRDDLIKMHAYRDAIRRSAGAYVLYPGDEPNVGKQNYEQYRELLPGLGAFVLRPTADGETAGSSALRDFLDQTLDHVAQRFSRHERGRYWIEDIHGRYDAPLRADDLFPFGNPTDETTVLLGYVKGAEHWAWIQKRRAYNVRAEGRSGGIPANASLLFSQLILLYGPEINIVGLARIVSPPEQVTASAMKSIGYPNPRSDYLCVGLSQIYDAKELGPTAQSIARLATGLTGVLGQPTQANWRSLFAE
jgi:predicted component of viral defense system (DUF524 family)